jgi:hypothetical protein
MVGSLEISIEYTETTHWFRIRLTLGFRLIEADLPSHSH